MIVDEAVVGGLWMRKFSQRNNVRMIESPCVMREKGIGFVFER